MAQPRMVKSAVLVGLMMMMMMLSEGATAQSSTSGCRNVLLSLSPCLNYISGNSSTPSSGCCTQLASVVQSSPQCLCEVLGGGGSSLGLSINQTQAISLPGACRIQTPPLSQCKAAFPGSSPTKSTESPTLIPSGSSSNTVPTTDSSSSNGSSNKISFYMLFTIVLIASLLPASTTANNSLLFSTFDHSHVTPSHYTTTTTH